MAENSSLVRSRCVPLLLVAAFAASPQTLRDSGVEFEAASVRPSAPIRPDPNGRAVFAFSTGGPGTPDPGRIFRPNLPLMQFLVTAFNLKRHQVIGPAWLETERYDITATMPPNTSADRYREMLQNLLITRFKMELHRESREMPAYTLTVAKNGPKFPAKVEAPAGVPLDKMPPEFMTMTGRGQILGKQQTLQQLADYLAVQIGAPVVDRTGLKGKHDLTLHYSTEGLNGPAGRETTDSTDRDLFSAIQSQLGLKLERTKAPVQVLVVDRAEKTPVAN